jgi:phosphatidylinositol-3-phosphatase
MKMRISSTRVLAGAASLLFAAVTVQASPAAADPDVGPVRAAIEKDKIKAIMVIELENQFFSTSFGPGSVATYLNGVLAPKGQIIENYYATSHVSQGNYISQISGQASNASQNNDCINFPSIFATNPPGTKIIGDFTDVTPATPAANGQIVGDGCVLPASVQTIANQLDAKKGNEKDGYPWRAYMEDMGNNPARDYGTPDPMGGTTCAHPPVATTATDFSNSASIGDGYATRHNPFMYFHSIIDNQALCDQRDVPLGKVTLGVNGAPDTFSGHLAQDLRKKETTPQFSMVVPNLCNDAHDAHCIGPDIDGGSSGGIVAGDLWLKHWMPMIMNSPSYRSGEMLVMITFDETAFTDTSNIPGDFRGPNLTNPGYSPLLGLFRLQTPPTAVNQYPGGGKVGALMLNNGKYVKPGTYNTTGFYNHYSALRSFEDMLGITTGGTDGFGHLGLAGKPGLAPFGKDVFYKQS